MTHEHDKEEALSEEEPNKGAGSMDATVEAEAEGYRESRGSGGVEAVS